MLFHVKKKAPKTVGSLRQLAAISASDSLRSIGEATNLAEEGLLPGNLVHDLEAAWTNCWTKRFFTLDNLEISKEIFTVDYLDII